MPLPRITNRAYLPLQATDVLDGVARAYRMTVNLQRRKLRLAQALADLTGRGMPPPAESEKSDAYRALERAVYSNTLKDIATAHHALGAELGAVFTTNDSHSRSYLERRMRAAKPGDALELANGHWATVVERPGAPNNFVRATYHGGPRHPKDSDGDWNLDGTKQCPGDWPEGSDVIRVVANGSNSAVGGPREALAQLRALARPQDILLSDVALALEYITELEAKVT